MTHSRFWTRSINLQAGYSGGLLPTGSTGPWNPEIFDPGDPPLGYFQTGIFRSGESETTDEVSYRLEMRGKTSAERYIGCLMLGIMPDEGLEEALQSLAGMLEYYSEQIDTWFSARQLPEVIDGTITGEKKRRDLVIT